MKFNGSAQDLETIVTALTRDIVSSSDKGDFHQIEAQENETINLYKNGTLQIQGSPDIKQKQVARIPNLYMGYNFPRFQFRVL